MDNKILKILVIDDNKDNLITVKAVISDNIPESQILLSNDSSSGVEMALSMDPDVILLDIAMPGKDGFEVCSQLKSNEFTNSIPVLFLTAIKKDTSSRIKALEVGAEGFLTKPFDELELTAQIRAMAKIKSANRLIKSEKERLETLVIERTLNLEKELSDRKIAESELLKASNNWNKTFQAMHDSIALLNTDHIIIQCNKAFGEFVKEDNEYLSGKNCFSYVHGTDKPVHNCVYEKMLKSKKRETSEMSVKGKTCEITVEPIFDQSGNITGAVHILSDITKRKHDESVNQILYEIAISSITSRNLEELLITVNDNLKKVLDTTNFFVAMYNPEKGTLKKVLFMDEKDDFEEWSINDTLSGQVIKKGRTILLNSIDREEFYKKNGVKTIGTPAACWLGVPIIVENSAMGVMVLQSYTNENAYNKANARLIEMVAHELAVVIERRALIQNLINSKEKAEEGDRLKTAFLQNMSHEIRTPMNGIMGFMELLNEPGVTDDEKSKYIGIMKMSGQRLLNTINDIIEISKIESGQAKVQISTVSVEELMKYHLDFFNKQVYEKGLTLTIGESITGDRALIKSDKHILFSILTNLVNNAVKFTQKGSIEIGNRIENNTLMFYVKDTGTGIPAERHNAIFERFIQADMNITRPHEGSGLGLAIVKAYIQMLGGKIWLESEVEKGSIFYFSVPYKPVLEEINLNPDENIASKLKNRDITVLIAEDDDISFEYLDILVSSEGVNVIHTFNGEETVNAIKENPGISLILMDIKMPVMNGLEATREIRKFNKTIPIIAQSAFALDGDKNRAIEVGCNDFLTKPIKKSDLFNKIELLVS